MKTLKYADIKWDLCNKKIFKLQNKIIVAWESKDMKKVYKLQETLVNTFEARALAVRKITSNKGSKTSGVDKTIIRTDIEKINMINKIGKLWNYQANPVKRIMIPKTNGKLRPLGIPSMLDRCVQALYLLALEPIAETIGDERSYGFRKYKSTQDVLAYLKTILSRENAPRIILDADIKGYFDNISHEWILNNIPMNKKILKQWLKCGYIYENKLNQTVKGVPQGGIISPIISNMVLDGLQEVISKASKEIEKEVLTEMRRLKTKSEGKYFYSSKIHFVRYADDFIITTNKEELLKKIMERVEEFLNIRGVELNKEKTKIYRIEEGFNFVGFNIRKYKTTTKRSGEIFIIYPTKKSIKNLKKKIKILFKTYKKGVPLIIKLNQILRGWGLYYRYSNASRIFTKLDHYIWKKSIKWVRNRNVRGKKSVGNAINKYYIMEGKRKWVFKDTKDNKIFKVFRLETIKILRYILVRNENPFINPEYFEQRILNKWFNSLSEIQIKLIKKQKGLCLVCKNSLNMIDEENLEIHHIQPREFKGTQTIRNLLLLHKTCHQSVTNCHDPNLLAKYVSEGIIKPLSKRYLKLLDKQKQKK